MPAGKDLPREAEDESSSEYTEVTEEELPAPETRSAAGKSGSFAPTPKPVVSEVPLASSESEDYVRPKGGRPKGEKPRVARTAATKRNSSSSSSPARPRSSKGSKGGKGKKSSAFTRCGHCWARVSTVHRNSLAQHQKWNHVCVTWQYHNKGLAWPDAQGKAQRKIERRQQKGWEPEKKRKKKKPHSPSPDARGPDRRRRRDPDTDSEDREGRHPKIHRQDGNTWILKLPKVR